MQPNVSIGSPSSLSGIPGCLIVKTSETASRYRNHRNKFNLNYFPHIVIKKRKNGFSLSSGGIFLQRIQVNPLQQSTIMQKGILTTLMVLMSIYQFAQDRLTAVSGSVSQIESGTLQTFTDLISLTMDVTGVEAVLVLTSFDTRYASAVNSREGMYKITDGHIEWLPVQFGWGAAPDPS
jgi:hypothetical protein